MLLPCCAHAIEPALGSSPPPSPPGSCHRRTEPAVSAGSLLTARATSIHLCPRRRAPRAVPLACRALGPRPGSGPPTEREPAHDQATPTGPECPSVRGG